MFIIHLKLNKRKCDFYRRHVGKIKFLCLRSACVCHKYNVYLRFVRVSDNRDKVSVRIVLFETHFSYSLDFFLLFISSFHSFYVLNIAQNPTAFVFMYLHFTRSLDSFPRFFFISVEILREGAINYWNEWINVNLNICNG